MRDLWPRSGRWLSSNPRTLFVLVALSRLAFVPWRVFLLVQSGGPTDLPYFLQLVRMSDAGLYPYVHFWVEYPPVFPGLALGLYRLGRLLATGPALEFWFYGLTIVAMIACELATLLMLYKLAGLLGDRESAGRSVLIYAGLFVPAYIWTGWFDHLPTLLFLSALYLLLRGRYMRSALLVGVGIMTKLFPLMLVPLALCVIRGLRRQVAYLLIVGLVVALFIFPFLAVNPSAMVASIRTALGRPSWETVWALLDGYYSYGIVAPLSAHIDPASASWASHSSSLPWMPITAVFVLLFALFYTRIYGARDSRRIVAAAAFTLNLLLLYSKGYSPQYLTWIAPLLVLLYPNRRGASYLAALSVLNLLELPLYFSFFPQEHALLVFTVLSRSALLVGLTWSYLAVALARPPFSLREARSARQPGW
jgi:hypothetical protein